MIHFLGSKASVSKHLNIAMYSGRIWSENGHLYWSWPTKQRWS